MVALSTLPVCLFSLPNLTAAASVSNPAAEWAGSVATQSTMVIKPRSHPAEWAAPLQGLLVKHFHNPETPKVPKAGLFAER